MNIDLEKTLKEIERKLIPFEELNSDRLHKAYHYVTKLRSQLLGVIYEIEHGFESASGTGIKLSELLSEGHSDGKMITLTIHEPLPILKELTYAMQDHWTELMQEAIFKATQDKKTPYFEKAFVWIEIITPKYTDNAKLWDTSNRAVNLIINCLKGVFFNDDNHENMAFGVTGNWGEKGVTIIHVLPFDKITQMITGFISGSL